MSLVLDLPTELETKLAAEAARLGRQLVARHDPIHEANAIRFGCVEPVAKHQFLLGPAQSHGQSEQRPQQGEQGQEGERLDPHAGGILIVMRAPARPPRRGRRP